MEEITVAQPPIMWWNRPNKMAVAVRQAMQELGWI